MVTYQPIHCLSPCPKRRPLSPVRTVCSRVRLTTAAEASLECMAVRVDKPGDECSPFKAASAVHVPAAITLPINEGDASICTHSDCHTTLKRRPRPRKVCSIHGRYLQRSRARVGHLFRGRRAWTGSHTLLHRAPDFPCDGRRVFPIHLIGVREKVILRSRARV